MVVAVQEGCEVRRQHLSTAAEVMGGLDLLNGFFFRNKKTVSRNSRYFVR